MPKTIDYTYVSGLRTHLTDLWAEAHAQWATWHDYHDQRHIIRYVKPAEVRKLGIARAKISSMVDTLVTNKPTVHRDVVAPGEAHKAQADKAENWGKGLLAHASVAGGAVPPFRTAATYLALLGYTAGVVRWDDKLWDEKGKVVRGPGYVKRKEAAAREQAKAFPFIIEFPHPARVLIPHQERRPSVALEIASMYRWQVEEMLRAEHLESRVDDLHGDSYGILEVLNCWDEKKRGLFIDGEEVEVRDNGLGTVPFVHCFSGYGFEHMPMIGGVPVSGTVPSLGSRPEDLAIGLLAGITDSIMALDEFTTAMSYLVKLATYPTYFTSEDAEELNQKIIQAGLGGVVQVRDPQTALKPSEVPQMGTWVFEHMRALRQDIDEGTYQGVVAGQMSPNVPTATGTAMQLGQARLRFGMPMQQLNLMAGEVLGLCARMTALRGETVTIDGHSCGADAFEGNYDFKVDFMAKDEGQLLRDKNSGMEEVKAGLLDFEGYQDAAGRPDATGMRKRIAIDKALASRQLQGAILQAATAMFNLKLAQRTPPQSGNGAGGPLLGSDGQPMPGQVPGFIPQPGGSQQAAQVQQGMEQVPGAGIARTVPSA